MNLSTINFKAKLLLSLLLLFAGVMDLLLGQLLLNTNIGMAPILLALAFVFILQDLFSWIRYSLLAIMACMVLYWVWSFISNVFTILEIIFTAMIQPATIPLFVSLALIGMLTFLFLKTDVIIQRNKK